MGLAGFQRARQRLLEQGVTTVAPTPKTPYVKQPDELKQYCGICDKTFNNFKAYEKHMQYKHTELYLENNPFESLPIDLQNKLKETE